jgi:WD40 repeat protein
MRVAFSPDGHRLASASKDGALRLWNADTGQPIGDPLLGLTGAISSGGFSRDGTRMVSGSDDHTVRLWPAVAGPTDLCNKLTPNMSHQQWRDWVSPPTLAISRVCPNLPVPADNPS